MEVEPHTQTKHRQGTFTAIADLIHKLTQEDKTEDEMLETVRKIRSFDVTTIGNLYFTSGGRIVLDKGCGEYFGKGEFFISLEELTTGIKAEEFRERLDKEIKRRKSND